MSILNTYNHLLTHFTKSKKIKMLLKLEKYNLTNETVHSLIKRAYFTVL